jgi:hypothetical protein
MQGRGAVVVTEFSAAADERGDAGRSGLVIARQDVRVDLHRDRDVSVADAPRQDVDASAKPSQCSG